MAAPNPRLPTVRERLVMLASQPAGFQLLHPEGPRHVGATATRAERRDERRAQDPGAFDEGDVRALRIYHIFLAFWHASLTAVAATLGALSKDDINTAANTYWLTSEVSLLDLLQQTLANGGVVPDPYVVALPITTPAQAEQWFDDNASLYYTAYGTLMAVFLGVTALSHVFQAVYVEHILEKRANLIRWAEYSFTAGYMMAMIMILSGEGNWFLLGAVGLMLWGTNMMGAVIELLLPSVEKLHPWTFTNTLPLTIPFTVASGLTTGPWVTEWVVYVQARRTVGDDVPAEIFWVILLEMLLYFSFAVVLTLYCFQCPPFQSFVRAEFGYATLSLVAKSLLAMLIVFRQYFADSGGL